MTFKNSKYFVMLFTTLFSGVVFAANSPCDGLQISAQSALIDLNTQSMTPITITISRSGNGNSCSFFVTGENAGYSSYLTRKVRHGGDFIPFQMYLDSAKTNILKSYTDASGANDVLSGTFTGGTSTMNVTYYPYVDSGFSAPDGPYLESYEFRLYEGTIAAKASAIKRDDKNTNMKYDKSGYVELSLVDTGAVYNATDTSQTLNFGNLATGAVRSFDLMLKYNGGYKLSMASVNGSNIRSGTRLIPYTMTLNGGGITLTTVSTIVRTHASDGGGTTSPSAGLRLPVSVTMGTVGTSPTGFYTDTVAISVASP